jgi:hypothetical protein
MLRVGVRGKAIWTGSEPVALPCASCGRRLLRAVVVQRYAHVFWIPFCPLGKREFFECSHCKRTASPEGAALEPVLRSARRSARTPRRYFFGSALLAALVAYGAVFGWIRGRRERGWIADPAVGDLYVLDSTALGEDPSGGFKHVVARVEGVFDSKVQVRFGTLAYKTAVGAKMAIDGGDLARPGYFGAEALPVPRSWLEEFFEKGSISAVVRE